SPGTGGHRSFSVESEVETGLKHFLASGVAPSPLRGGLRGAAEVVRGSCKDFGGGKVQSLRLGDLRSLLRRFLERGLLMYLGHDLVVTQVLIDEFQEQQKPVRTFSSI
ncbi:unnamed protein product, partial [Polarella glacialis]